MNEFAIGDIVRIKAYDDIPREKKAEAAHGDPSLITPRKSGLCGAEVEIVDKLYSERYDDYIYRVKEQSSARPSRAEFTEDFLEPICTDVRYVCEIEDRGDVVSAVIYEERDGECHRVAQGFGRVMDKGALGFTQALSYALMRAYRRLRDGAGGGTDGSHRKKHPRCRLAQGKGDGE